MRLVRTLTLCAALMVAAGSLVAQEAPGPTRNVPDSLVAKVKINEDSARAIALKRVPGTVQDVTLRQSRTRLTWEFKIQRSGRKSTSDVQVNANTGKVIAVRAGTGAKARTTTHRSS